MLLEDDLYVYLWENPYENNCNSYLIKGEITVLIDPGHSRYFDNLCSRIEHDGISLESIRLIITTHCHPDHFEAVERFMGKPAKMAMSREEERYLLEHGKYLFEMMGTKIPSYRTDFFLRAGTLQLGGKCFEIIETAGHSPGSLSIYWPERKVLITGDVLFYGGIGRTDFVEGNSQDLVSSIERLAQLDTEILLPGHGEIIMGKAQVLENFEYIRQAFYPYL